VSELEDNLRRVQVRVRAACERVGRRYEEVGLVAVSKGHVVGAVDALVAEGQFLFGESKVQEARLKITSADSRARWHMIGHLQTNKCRDVVRMFELVESVDSMRLALELDRCAERAGRQVGILVEVNIAGEASKFGYTPEALLGDLDALAGMGRVDLLGLMTMAPWSPDPERSRPVFRRLAELRKECEDRLGVPLPHLSMGMSGDFEVGIEEGATLVRVGTAIFGERSRPAKHDGLR
jgi:pyridoxal phosphate enzyme (YggS family)